MLKISVILFCFNLNLYLFDLLMGETENLEMHDFLIFGTRRNPYLWIRIYQIAFTNLRKVQETFSKAYYVLNIWNLES